MLHLTACCRLRGHALQSCRVGLQLPLAPTPPSPRAQHPPTDPTPTHTHTHTHIEVPGSHDAELQHLAIIIPGTGICEHIGRAIHQALVLANTAGRHNPAGTGRTALTTRSTSGLRTCPSLFDARLRARAQTGVALHIHQPASSSVPKWVATQVPNPQVAVGSVASTARHSKDGVDDSCDDCILGAAGCIGH